MDVSRGISVTRLALRVLNVGGGWGTTARKGRSLVVEPLLCLQKVLSSMHGSEWTALSPFVT